MVPQAFSVFLIMVRRILHLQTRSTFHRILYFWFLHTDVFNKGNKRKMQKKPDYIKIVVAVSPKTFLDSFDIVAPFYPS